MKHIFISGLAYDKGQSGISDYINNCVAGLAETCRVDIALLENDIEVFPVKHENLTIIPISQKLEKPVVNMLWHLFILPGLIKKIPYDFVFLPAGNRRLISQFSSFTIATMHDLSQYHVEGKYDWKRMLYIKKVIPFFLKKVDAIIAVSENTKKDLETFYHIPGNRITVLHNGYNKKTYNDNNKALPKEFITSKPYVLYVARIEHPGKNHLRLIKAYEKLHEEVKKQFDLVCCGSFKEQSDIVKDYVLKSKDRTRIHFTGFVKQDTLPAIYKNATLFILPSLYEGFGIPAVEAMASGVPVILSKAGSLPEVGGYAVAYIDPFDVDSIKSKLENVLTDRAKQAEMIKKGLQQAKKFSWKKHVEGILNIADEKEISTINIFGVDVLNLSMNRAIENIDEAITKKEKGKYYFVNADCFNKMHNDPVYYQIVRDTKFVFGDGSGVRIAAQELNHKIIDNVNGTDMLPLICTLCMKKKYSIFFLGAKPGVADKMVENLTAVYDGLKIAGTQDGYFDRKKVDEVIERINASNADILLVAFGAPLQEAWIHEHSSKINTPVQMGVGGLFDFYSGNMPRAPKWMRSLGIEWVFRLMMEPGRMWRRYIIGNPLFLKRLKIWKKRGGGLLHAD